MTTVKAVIQQQDFLLLFCSLVLGVRGRKKGKESECEGQAGAERVSERVIVYLVAECRL